MATPLLERLTLAQDCQCYCYSPSDLFRQHVWYCSLVYSQPIRRTLQLGVSFIPDYASSLGLNPEQTMSALINRLHVKHFRLTSYWSDVEPTKGNYNFSQLDWEFAMADKAHAKITLVVGCVNHVGQSAILPLGIILPHPLVSGNLN